MSENTNRQDPVTGESLSERDFQAKLRLGIIPVVSVPELTQQSILSVKKRSGGCVPYVSKSFLGETSKKNHTSSEAVN